MSAGRRTNKPRRAPQEEAGRHDAPSEQEPARRGEEDQDSGGLEHPYSRVQYLYEISKQLTRFEGTERTVPAILATLARALPLRTALLLLDVPGRPRIETIVWSAEGVSADRLQAAKSHATTSYVYLAGSDAGRRVDRDGAPSTTSATSRQAARDPRAGADERGNFLVLPLVVERRPIFGALQIEGAARLEEPDLVFMNAAANQLAIALDRQVVIDAKQAAAEAARGMAERRQAESDEQRAIAEALRQRYEALVDNLDQAFVWEADARTFQVLYVSARAEALLGHPRERWLAEPDFWSCCTTPDDGGALERTFRRTLASAKDQRCDHRCLTADGRALWLHTGVHLVKDGAGAPRLQGVSLDITPAKEAEARVREQLEFTRAVTGSIGEGVLAIDREGRITFYNHAAERSIGWTAEEVVGRRVQEVVLIQRSDGTSAPDEEHPALRAIRTGELARSDDHLLSRRDRTFFHVSCTFTPLKRAGQVSGAVLVFLDITAVKQAEKVQRLFAEVSAVLASSLDYAETIASLARLSVPALADLYFVDLVDEDGRVERLEPASAAPEKESLAERMVDLGRAAGWATPQERVLQTGEPLLIPEITGSAVEADDDDSRHGGSRRAAASGTVMVVPLVTHGRPLGALTFIAAESGRRYTTADLAVAQEVAHRAAMALENARLYRQAQRAIRTRDDFLAVVSHDLRNPLSSILAAAALLMRTLPVGEQGAQDRRRAEVILLAAQRMLRLIGDLLDVAAIESGRLSMEKRRHAASALVHDAIEMEQALAMQKHLVLESEPCAGDSLEVLCDRERVLQVFANLIGNAIKFTAEGGTITVRAEPHGDEALFAVTDTGPGIRPDELPHVFDRFWQVAETARLGTGLGLTIAKGFVEALGGRIWAESQVGAGATFFFTLPLARPEGAAGGRRD
ncbi:sensor histidine kinase [Sorangium sp. So ce381]|uniref:PAS domain-containing sensor histidine kinase n=1 Tax=Sorangium sp. So ce381 TaxID=3133307 RepID=UPI003F5C427E